VQQKGSAPARICMVKTKPITKEQVWKNLQCHKHKEQKEIALELLKGVWDDQLTPRMQKAQQKPTPVVMEGLSILKDKPKDWDTHTEGALTCICTMSTLNLTRGCWIAQGYAKLATSVKECEVNKELR